MLNWIWVAITFSTVLLNLKRGTKIYVNNNSIKINLEYEIIVLCYQFVQVFHSFPDDKRNVYTQTLQTTPVKS